ncbi:MAG: hypothetical protein AAB490_01725 [Patescibacteria group bacterium]
MRIKIFKLTADPENQKVTAAELWPLKGPSTGGLDQLTDLPSIPESEAIAIELWPEQPDSQSESDHLSELDRAGCRYVANEHHGYFYSFTILAGKLLTSDDTEVVH